jgi:hypothetical protein
VPAHRASRSTVPIDADDARITIDGGGDWLAMDRRIPLADFECRHGRLPGDMGKDCDCWRGA